MPQSKPTIIITGANGGLGIGFVQNLLASPKASTHHTIYTVRNPSTATTLNTLLKTSAPSTHSYAVIALDLNSLDSVRKTASEINLLVSTSKTGPIAALILNAAWQEASAATLTPQTYTKDGYESHFGINYLSNYLLTLLLLQSMEKEHGRIVLVSSYSHNSYDPRFEGLGITKDEEYKEMFRDGGVEEWSKGIVYTDDGWKAGMRRYAASKLAMVFFMYELQKRLNVDPLLSNISVLSVDPGAMGGTSLVRESPTLIRILVFILWVVQPILVYFNPNGTYRTPKKSGADLLLAAFDSKYLGEYPKAEFLDGSLKSVSSVESRDEGKQKRLWEGSVKLAGLKEEDTVLADWK